MDATAFPIPKDPAVFYLANPFAEKVMRIFLGNIENSLSQKPRDMYILYYNPVVDRMWEDSRYFSKVRATSEFSVYRSVTQ
jgi:hypothetical protein